MQIFVDISNSNKEKQLLFRKQLQIEAVERGFGEWKINNDGNIEFKWKDIETLEGNKE